MPKKTLNISLPLSVSLGKYKNGKEKKPFRLNLNIYRNSNSFLLNTAKKNFKELVKQKNVKIKFEGKVFIIYILQVKTKRKSDLMNWVSVVDKFFLDALVELQIIKEDNYNYVPLVLAIFKGKGEDEKIDVRVTENIKDVTDIIKEFYDV